MTLPTPHVPPAQRAWGDRPPIDGPPGKKPLWKKKKFYIPVAIFLLLGGIGAVNSPTPVKTTAVPPRATTSATPTAIDPAAAQKALADKAAADAAAKATAEKLASDKAAAEANRTGPADEQAFVAAVSTGRRDYQATDNELKQRQGQKERNDAICAAEPSGQMSNWVGALTDISTNNSGKGVVEIELADGTKVGTWNNAFSDFEDHTLIEMNSPVYTALVDMKNGDRVRFSGSLLSNSTSCFSEQSITLHGQMTTPTFLLHVSAITKV